MQTEDKRNYQFLRYLNTRHQKSEEEIPFNIPIVLNNSNLPNNRLFDFDKNVKSFTYIG
jgi:hypothetical protein